MNTFQTHSRTSYPCSRPRMTVVKSGKVLVTGANGYIAVWLVQKLLEQGYSVRGTVRSASRIKYLKKLFERYGDKFELVVVEDITKVRLCRFLCVSPATEKLIEIYPLCRMARLTRSSRTSTP